MNMGIIKMGNNSTTGFKGDENVIVPELPGKSSPGTKCEDSKIVENQIISTGKADDIHEKSKTTGNTDASDKIPDITEQPELEAPPPEALKIGGETVDKKNETTLLSEKSGNGGSSLSGDVGVEADHQFESEDLSAKPKDDPDLETSVDHQGDVKQPEVLPERVNGIFLVSNSMENGGTQESGYSNNVVIDSAPEAVIESSQKADQMDLENNEVLHLEGSQTENVPVSHLLQFLDDKGGTSEEREESGCSNRVVADFALEPILESLQRTEEVDRENNEVPQPEGNQMENVSVSRSSEFPDGKGGIPPEMKESGDSSNAIADFVPEAILDASRKTDQMDRENNEIPHPEGDQMENLPESLPSKLLYEGSGISGDMKATGSDSTEKVIEEEKGDADAHKGLVNEPKVTLKGDEQNHQPQCDEVLGLACTNNDETIPTDVPPSHFEDQKQCQVETETIAEKGFQADGSSKASEVVVKERDREEEESSKRGDILPDEHEATEAPCDAGVDEKEAARQFTPSPKAKQFDDEESQSSASSSYAHQNPEAAVSDFEFEKPTADLEESLGTSLGFKLDTRALDNGYGNPSIKSQLSGILNGEQEAEESTERLSSDSNSDSINGTIFPQMQKSPSFGLHIRPESDQTPLLFQDKVEIMIPMPQEKAVTVTQSDSEESKTPFLRSRNREENEEQELGTCATTQKHDNYRGKEKTMRGKARRKLGSSLFGNCMCCGSVINN